MQTSDEIKETIRTQTDIVDIIGEYVSLKKRGKNYIGLCPFHNEKSPSFNVSQDGQFYKCFGCGKYGDCFKFIMDYNSIGFVDALKILANKAGITLEQFDTKKDSSKSTLREQVIECLKDATTYFETELINPENIKAIEYYKNRDFTKETISKFALGYSTASWDGVYNHLKDKGYGGNVILEAGLVIKRDTK